MIGGDYGKITIPQVLGINHLAGYYDVSSINGPFVSLVGEKRVIGI